MPKFAANLSTVFTEYPFVERFDRAAQAGFKAVEFQFPYAGDVQAIDEALTRNGLEQVLFNLPAGDFAAGDRGLANDPRREQEFREGVATALSIAARLRCPKLNCLVGRTRPNVHEKEQFLTLERNLRYAADAAADAGVSLVIEPLNLKDMPDFFIGTPSAGFAFLERLNHPNVKLQYDVYHAQRSEGNVVATFRERLGLIGHVQIADSPDRHEPGTGEINFPFVLQALDEAGYDGWVGLEYNPSGRSEDSFAWMA